MAYTSKGYINIGATHLMDENGTFIKDEYGRKIVATFLFPMTHTTGYSDVSPTAYFHESRGIIRTASEFLKDEFGNFITDEFGNKIATVVIPGSIYSAERHFISMGTILFWGTGRSTYNFITELAS